MRPSTFMLAIADVRSDPLVSVKSIHGVVEPRTMLHYAGSPALTACGAACFVSRQRLLYPRVCWSVQDCRECVISTVRWMYVLSLTVDSKASSEQSTEA